MGLLRTTMGIANPLREHEWRELPGTLVDSGSELSWVPRPVLESLGIRPRKRVRFAMANGDTIERNVQQRLLAGGPILAAARCRRAA